MLELAFMQRALIAAVVVGIVCGALGFFVVLRRLAFVGVGLSHSAIGGVAIGILAGLSPLASGAVFAIAVALGIAALGRTGRIGEDAVIGVFFSGSMALAVVLFSLERGYQQDLFGYLFGNVLAITTGEVWVLVAVGAAVLAVLAVSFQPLLFVAFDGEVARAYGQRVSALDRTLLVLLAATIVIGVRLVGVLLIEALLVVPAAAAALLAENWRRQLLLSALLGSACGAAGLLAAFALDLAAGGTIALLALGVFLLALVARRVSR